VDFAERDKCKPVLLRLSLAGNLEKPILSRIERSWLWTQQRIDLLSCRRNGAERMHILTRGMETKVQANRQKKNPK
jgi:hypothetical protein